MKWTEDMKKRLDEKIKAAMKDATAQITMPKIMYDKLEKLAKRENRSVSQMGYLILQDRIVAENWLWEEK